MRFAPGIPAGLAAAAAAWMVFAVAALWLCHGVPALDSDSAMRLVQVRDLLHGQNWFDTTQTRMNTPYGLPMHWSRLADAPIALLILVSHSEAFAITVWPLLLFLAALFLLARLGLALGGRAATVTVLILALLCTHLFHQFAPGSIDHHNLQLVLMLAALTGIVERRAVPAAIAVALALGVGLESLPYVLVAIAAAVLWLRDDHLLARRFGIAVAATALLLLCATTASAYRAAPACDTYSVYYAVLLAVGGAGLAGISCLSQSHRLAACAALAVMMLGLAALLNPLCFAGPYAAMSTQMHAVFLSRINEAQPVWIFAHMAPSETIAGYGYAAAALAGCFFAPRSRARIWIIAFAAMALLVATLQIRAVPFAILFALPGLAAALVRLTGRRSIVVLAAMILAGNDAAFALAGARLEGPAHLQARTGAFQRQENCAGSDATALLTPLPRGRVAAFVDQGPAILAVTGDAVIAGPYHRNAAGILDTYAIFTGPDPRAILARRGIDYLMTCSAAPDWNFYRARGGLIARLAANRQPDWLTETGRAGDVVLYRVVR